MKHWPFFRKHKANVDSDALRQSQIHIRHVSDCIGTIHLLLLSYILIINPISQCQMLVHRMCLEDDILQGALTPDGSLWQES